MAGHQTGHPIRPWMAEARERRARAHELALRSPDVRALEVIEYWIPDGAEITVRADTLPNGEPGVTARVLLGMSPPLRIVAKGHGRTSAAALDHLAREIDPAVRR